MDSIFLKPLIISIIVVLLILPPFFTGGRDYFILPLFLISCSLLLLLYNLGPGRKHENAPKNNWPLTLSIWLWGLFLFIGAFSLFYSVSPYKSIDFYILLLGYFVLFFVLSRLKFRLKEIRIFVLLLLGCGSILSLIGIYYYLFGQYSRVISTFYWSNPFAGYLLLILPLALGMFFKSKERADLVMYAAVAGLLVSAFILTQSRASYLSFIIPLFVLGWIFRRVPKKEILAKLAILLLGVFILVTIVFSAKAGSPTLFFLSREAQEDTDVSLSLRWNYWKGAFKIFKDYPLFGSGLATFGIVYPAYQESPLAFSKYAHNHYLQMLSEVGVLGAIPFFLLIISLIFLGLRAIKKKFLKVSEEDFYMIFFFCGILGSLIHNGADFDWYFPANFITFWILAGLFYGLYLKKFQSCE